MPIATRNHRPALLLLVLAHTLPHPAQTAPATAPAPAAPAAPAISASHRARAKELVDLLQTEKAVRQNEDNMLGQVKQVKDQLGDKPLTPEQKAKVDVFEKKASDTIEEEVGWKTLEPLFADSYAKVFTEDQLTGIIAFYKSPIGAAFLDKTTALNEQNVQFEKTKMTALTAQLRQLLADLQKDLTPPAASAPAPTAPPASSTPPAKPSAPAPATSTPR